MKPTPKEPDYTSFLTEVKGRIQAARLQAGRAVAEKKTHNFELALPEHFAEQADEMLKSRYNLEFLGLARPMKERELEERLISRLQQFILELGYGFCFVGHDGGAALPCARGGQADRLADGRPRSGCAGKV